MANDGDLGSRRRESTVCRTEDDVIALIFQGMVVANDDIGMILVNAVTGYRIMGTDEVVALAINQRRIEAIDIVELRRGIVFKSCIIFRGPSAIIIFLLISFDRIANTYDLGHVGIIYDVAAAKGHDLSATFRNGILQDFLNCLHIICQVCLCQLLKVLVIQLHVPIGIGDSIVGPHNDCCIGILGIVHLPDHTTGYAIERHLVIRIDDIQSTYGQRSRSLVTVRICIRRNDLIAYPNGDAGNPVCFAGRSIFSGCLTCCISQTIRTESQYRRCQ